MPKEGDAAVDILDIQGRLVRSVHRGVLAAGEHRLEWDGRDEAGNAVAPGLYMARLHANAEERLLKLVRAN
jgi:flagellar hook assembly protein FlgD